MPVRLVLLGRSFLLLALAAACPAASFGGGAAPPPQPAPRLEVSTHHGFIPIEVVLTIDLGALDPAEVTACSVEVEWKGDVVLGMTQSWKRRYPCLEKDAPATLSKTFTRTITHEREGTYAYRVFLERKESESLATNVREVKAVRSAVELKYSVTGTGP